MLVLASFFICFTIVGAQNFTAEILIDGAPCFGNSKSVRTRDSCYVFVQDKTISTLQDADNYCSKQGFGSLASISQLPGKHVLTEGAKRHLAESQFLVLGHANAMSHPFALEIASGKIVPSKLIDTNANTGFACSKSCCWDPNCC